MPHDGSLDLTSVEAIAWTLTALAVVLSIGRYGIRYALKKRFHWDDLTHLLALLAFIAMVGLFQRLFPDGYFITAIQKKLVPLPPQKDYMDLYLHFRGGSYGIALLFFTSTWLVKLTFLLFYWFIFEVSVLFRRVWWIVSVFVLVTYWIPVAGVLTQCGPTRNAYNYIECTTPAHIKYGNQVLAYTCAVSVVTDVMIMALPLWFLKNLKVDVPQKVGLILMLSLGLVIIAFEILRTVKSMEQTSFSEVAVYDIVEGFVAIVVNCIPTYRLLLTSSRRRKSSPYANFNDPSGSTRTGDSHPLQYVRDPSMSSTTRTDIDPCSLEPRGMGRYQEESIAVPKHTYA